jgi:outer membrane usher protein FimD/PapC
LRADVLDNLEGRGGLQYGITAQSAVAMSGTEVGVGARELEDSAIIVDVGGDAGNSTFQVMVNGSSEGHVRAGGSLSIHLEPYRAYEVRLRPDGAAPVTFDADAQTVTLYPGTVRVVRWTAHSYFTAFGKAVSPDGTPLANAMVKAPHSIGETDDNGYFQVDVANDDMLTFTRGSQRCEVRVTGAKPTNDLASLGKVICQ